MLIVEDGTGKADAEAYISVADADTYFENRGYTLWAGLSDTEKEQALRRATDYMENMYGPRWKGERVSVTQALSWPRTETDYDSDEVPHAVRRANAELAFRAAQGELMADQGAQVKSKTVGPIAITYADGARQSTRYAAVESMLTSAGIMNGGGNSISVVRA